MSEQLSPEHQRNIAAMNNRVYAMSEQDRERWYRDHPVSRYADADDTGSKARDEIIRDLALVLERLNLATLHDQKSVPLPEQARRRLCEALGIQRLDETPSAIVAKLREALS
jgi:hypothetical protein